jgi:hypothetical protein
MVMSRTSKLSNGDIDAHIAYIRSVPAAGQPTPNPLDALSPLGLVLLGAASSRQATGLYRHHHRPTQGADCGIRRLLLSCHNCRTCHGTDLTGGVSRAAWPYRPGGFRGVVTLRRSRLIVNRTEADRHWDRHGRRIRRTRGLRETAASCCSRRGPHPSCEPRHPTF